MTETLATLQNAGSETEFLWAKYSTGSSCVTEPTLPNCMPQAGRSAPEEVADFDEQLPAIVDVPIGGPQEARSIQIALLRPRLMDTKGRIHVFKIRVVADINGGAGVRQIREQKIEIHVLGGLQ